MVGFSPIQDSLGCLQGHYRSGSNNYRVSLQYQKVPIYISQVGVLPMDLLNWKPFPPFHWKLQWGYSTIFSILKFHRKHGSAPFTWYPPLKGHSSVLSYYRVCLQLPWSMIFFDYLLVAMFFTKSKIPDEPDVIYLFSNTIFCTRYYIPIKCTAACYLLLIWDFYIY